MALKTFAGIRDFEVSGPSLAGPNNAYRQFPGSSNEVKLKLGVVDTITYNLTTSDRTTLFSQQGDSEGFSTEHVTPFIEGTFYIKSLDSKGRESIRGGDVTQVTRYIQNHVNVKVQATDRSGYVVALDCAHATRVDDVDMVAGTFSCRWEGNALV